MARSGERTEPRHISQGGSSYGSILLRNRGSPRSSDMTELWVGQVMGRISGSVWWEDRAAPWLWRRTELRFGHAKGPSRCSAR